MSLHNCLTLQGDQAFKKYWNKVESNPNEYIYPSIPAGLQELQNKPHTIMYELLSRMTYHYKANSINSEPGLQITKLNSFTNR